MQQLKQLSTQKLTFILVGLLTGAVSQADTNVTKTERVLITEVRQFANLMPVIGPTSRPVRSHITFEALSGGCTRAEDFRVDVKVSGTGQQLSLVRIRPDFCEAVVHRKVLEVETEKLALTSHMPLFIANPVYADEKVVY